MRSWQTGENLLPRHKPGAGNAQWRVSVCNWQTTEADVSNAINVVKRLAGEHQQSAAQLAGSVLSQRPAGSSAKNAVRGGPEDEPSAGFPLRVQAARDPQPA